MTNKSFSRLNSYIADICSSNEELRNMTEQLEDALKEQEEMSLTKDGIRKDVYNLRVDLMLVRQAASMIQEEREKTNNCAQILMTSYGHLLEINNFLENDRIKNISRFTVLQKQNEVQKKLNRLEELQNININCKAAMESRKIVKEFRKRHWLVKEAEEEYLNIERESDLIDRQWKTKTVRAEQQRNKKITSLVQISKQIGEEFKYRLSGRSLSMQKERHANKSVMLPVNNAPIALQSALEFLSNYPGVCKVAEKSAIDNKKDDNDLQLRSILVVNRPLEDSNELERTPSPSKQVHFAQIPPINQVEGSSGHLIQQVVQFPVNVIELSSDLETGNLSSANSLRVCAVIENVEVLPTLNLSMSKDQSLPMDLSDSNEAVIGNVIGNLKFDSMFRDTEYTPDNGSDVKDEDEGEENKIVTPTKTENIFQLSPRQSIQDDSNSVNGNQTNTMNFSGPVSDVKDFFLNFSEVSNAQGKDNSHMYDL